VERHSLAHVQNPHSVVSRHTSTWALSSSSRLAFRVTVTADDWSKRRGRAYHVHIEWAGETFVRGEGVLAQMQARS